MSYLLLRNSIDNINQWMAALSKINNKFWVLKKAHYAWPKLLTRFTNSDSSINKLINQDWKYWILIEFC